MTRAVDLTGLRFGRLTVLGRSIDKARKDRRAYWTCQCDCGNTKVVSSACLIQGHTLSCGCLREEYARCNTKIMPRRPPTIFYEYNGKSLTIPELSEATGISENTIRGWRYHGFDVMEKVNRRVKE